MASALVGESNIPFFKQLREAGITPEDIPVMLWCIDEHAVRVLGVENMTGHYAAYNYFQSIESDRNSRFVRSFKDKYGEDRVLEDPMEAAYISVHLWAQAVSEAATENVDEVRAVLRNQSFEAPEGLVHVDRSTQHIWKTVRIAKIRRDGQFDIVWTSDRPVNPVP